MTQSFDARRWWLLVGKHWSENRKKYTLSLIAMAGLLLLWFAFIMITGEPRINTELQLVTFYSGLFIVGCLYASTLFAELGSKTRGLNYLVVPASHLEKLLCALFYGVVVFFVCYTAIFYIIDIIAVKASNAFEYSIWLKRHTAGSVFIPEKVYNVFNSPDNHGDQPGFTYYLLLGYFVLQAAFICGSVYFAKFSFIKSVISLILAGLLAALFIGKVVIHILPAGHYNDSLTSYQVFTEKPMASGDGVMIYSDDATDKTVSIPAWIGDTLLFLLKYAFAPLLWLATFYRLKEKEI